MRRFLARVLRRLVRMAIAYPPIFMSVRDFLRDNPEALLKMTEGRQFARALVSQNGAMLALTSTGGFWRRFATDSRYQDLLLKGIKECSEDTRGALVARIVATMPDTSTCRLLIEQLSQLPEANRLVNLSRMLTPHAANHSRARMVASAATLLAENKDQKASQVVYELFRAWEGVSHHLAPDWQKELTLFSNLDELRKSGFNARLAHLIERVSKDGVISLKGGKFSFSDPASFAEVADEILAREQYYFKSDSAQPYVLDCGVNAGLAIYYVKTLHPSARVIGFEPFEPMADLARENVKQLGLTDVTIETVALSETEGELPLEVSDNPLGHRLANPDADAAASSLRMVKTDVLSKYVTEPVDFVKLDIEGAEYGVLHELGIERLKLIKNMFCEYHIGEMDDWSRLADVIKLLRVSGFNLQLESASWAQRSRSYRPLTQAHKTTSLSIYATRSS